MIVGPGEGRPFLGGELVLLAHVVERAFFGPGRCLEGKTAILGGSGGLLVHH
jgi:hypothetical protein